MVDENSAAVGDARVAFKPAANSASAAVIHTVACPTGAFEVRLPDAGDYVVNVQRDSYFQLRDYPVKVSGQNHTVTLVINHVREVFQTLDVNDAPPPIDFDRTNAEQRLTGPEIMNIPVPSTHSLRNSLKVMPSVLQDPQGELHLSTAAAENQVLYTLNGFNISDPLTGGGSRRGSSVEVGSIAWTFSTWSIFAGIRQRFGRRARDPDANGLRTWWRYFGHQFHSRHSTSQKGAASSAPGLRGPNLSAPIL